MANKLDSREDYNRTTFLATLTKLEKAFGTTATTANDPNISRRTRLQEAIDFGRNDYPTARQLIGTLDNAITFLNDKVLDSDGHHLDNTVFPNITKLKRRAGLTGFAYRFPTIFAQDKLGPGFRDRVVMATRIANENFSLMDYYKFDKIAPDAESRFAAGTTDFLALASATLFIELARFRQTPEERLDLLLGAVFCEAIAATAPKSRLFKNLDKLSWFTPAYRISPQLDAQVHSGQQSLTL